MCCLRRGTPWAGRRNNYRGQGSTPFVLESQVDTALESGHHSWSTRSCPVERSTARQDSSTGFPSSLQSDPRCFEQCIAPGSRRPRLQRNVSLHSQRAGGRKARSPRRSPRTAVKDVSSLPVNKGMRVEGQTMDRISRVRFRSNCGTVSKLGTLREYALYLMLIVTSGIQIGNSWSTRSCPVERSTARQDSSTGFPSSLQSDPRCFEQCIAPGSRRPRL